MRLEIMVPVMIWERKQEHSEILFFFFSVKVTIQKDLLSVMLCSAAAGVPQAPVGQVGNGFNSSVSKVGLLVAYSIE